MCSLLTPIDGDPRLFSRDGVRGTLSTLFAEAEDRPPFADLDRTFTFTFTFAVSCGADTFSPADPFPLAASPALPIGLNDCDDVAPCADLLRERLCFRGPRFAFDSPPRGISCTNLPVNVPSAFTTPRRATGGVKNDCGRSRLLIGITKEKGKEKRKKGERKTRMGGGGKARKEKRRRRRKSEEKDGGGWEGR